MTKKDICINPLCQLGGATDGKLYHNDQCKAECHRFKRRLPALYAHYKVVIELTDKETALKLFAREVLNPAGFRSFLLHFYAKHLLDDSSDDESSVSGFFRALYEYYSDGGK